MNRSIHIQPLLDILYDGVIHINELAVIGADPATNIETVTKKINKMNIHN